MTPRLVVTGLGMVSPLGANSTTTFKRILAGDRAKTILTGSEWRSFVGVPRAAQALEDLQVVQLMEASP